MLQIPLHLEPVQQNETSDKRLWIGNLDLRVNEYVILCVKFSTYYGSYFNLQKHESNFYFLLLLIK